MEALTQQVLFTVLTSSRRASGRQEKVKIQDDCVAENLPRVRSLPAVVLNPSPDAGLGGLP